MHKYSCSHVRAYIVAYVCVGGLADGFSRRRERTSMPPFDLTTAVSVCATLVLRYIHAWGKRSCCYNVRQSGWWGRNSAQCATLKSESNLYDTHVQTPHVPAHTYSPITRFPSFL